MTAEELVGKKFPVLDDGHVILLDYMGDDEAIVSAARTSYQKGTKKTSDSRTLLRYLMRHSHTTPFEMCLAGDTKIPTFPCEGATVKTYTLRQIAEAFAAGGKSSSWVKLLRIRTVNPQTGVVAATKVRRAWKTGTKPAFRVEVDAPFRRSVVVTDNHPFLTPTGFKTVKEMKVGDPVLLNGVPALMPDVRTEILRRRASGERLLDVAGALGVSPSVVQKYAPGRARRRKGFLKKPEGTHLDPRAIARRRKGKGACEVAGCESDGHVHHVDENPHNNDLLNLRRLCRKHHKHAHTMTRLEKAVAGSIARITPVGDLDVYDLEVEDSNHTFVADGFVVHNCEVKLHVRVPMDCWRQWIRHRTASVNEYSTRYSEAIDLCQTTDHAKWRLQAKGNKQGSSGYLEGWPDNVRPAPQSLGGGNNIVRLNSGELAHRDAHPGGFLSYREQLLHKMARDVYQERLELGVAREQARKDLPLSTYTEAVWKCDLHNVLNFLRLRMDAHAQEEIRAYANVIGREIVAKLFPIVWEAFLNYRLNALTLSAQEVLMIKCILSHEPVGSEGEDRLTGRELLEFGAKLERLGMANPFKEAT